MPKRAHPSAGYSIRVASRLTGIQPDTLRVWERRYGVPKPARRSGGARLYSEDDVALLRLVARGLGEGFRPNELLGLRRAEIEKRLRAVSPSAHPEPGLSPSLASIVEALLADDADRVRADLRRAAAVLGARRFVTQLAHPLVVRVGELWAAGELEVRHEHFVSECLSTQMRVLLAAYEESERPPVVLLATLPGEAHALGITMVALLLAVLGSTPRLLGPGTPVRDVVEAAIALHASVVGVTVTRASERATTERNLRALVRALPKGTRLWLGGEGAEAIPLRSRALVRVRSFDDLDAALDAARGEET